MNLCSIPLRLRNLFHKRQLDRELHAELSTHLALHAEDNLRKGMSPQEARRDALLRLGGLEQTKQRVRDQQTLPFLESLLQDFRFALRLLKKSPAFSSLAILTLALGIGGNTAIFTLLDQALFRSLPVKEPKRLVLLRYSGKGEGGASYTRGEDAFYFSYPMYRDLRDRNSIFNGLIATAWTQVGVQWHGQTQLADAELVSGNYFDVLGVQSTLGRLFVPSDDLTQEANPVAVLSFDYWRRQFGSEPRVVNQSILINGHPLTIVGVTWPGFHSVVPGDAPAIFVPMTMKPLVTPGWNDLDERRSSWLNIIGRLSPGIGRQQAQAGIEPLWHSIRAAELNERSHSSPQFRDAFLAKSHLFLDDGSSGAPIHGSVPTMLLVVMAMAALMILMACANVGTLLLVRAAARTREISVRFALGATRNRLLQQLLADGILLGLAGGLLGILLAPQVSALLIRAIWAETSGSIAFSPHPDLRILIFNFSLALVVTVLFSFAPALQFWCPDLTPALKQQSSRIVGAPLRLRRASVVAQIALSLLLLVAAGLFARTLRNLKSLDVGFATDHLVTFSADPNLAGYQPTFSHALYQRILDNLSSLPGVRSAAATDDPELADNNTSRNFTVVGYHPSESEEMNAECPKVSPEYFSTLRMPLLTGRELTAQDRLGSQKVAVVNELFARRYFGQPQNAIGRYFGWGAGDVKIEMQIVGVVENAKHTTVRDNLRSTIFTPFFQDEDSGGRTQGMTFYVRTWQVPEAAESAIRQAMQSLDSRLVLDNFRTMREQVDKSLLNERVVAFLASSFGLIAALMAAIGVYGVMAYTTGQRIPEIGIRMAFGATAGNVVRMVLSEVLGMAGLGIAAGLPLSLLFGHAVRSQLFGVSKNDPLTLCLAVVLVAAVALVAAALPARRASRVDPVTALRYE